MIRPSTDTRLRAHARAAATGGPEERARLLLERVRSGELARERVELAAYCGDEAARGLIDLNTADWGSRQGDDEPGDCPSCDWYLVHRVGCSHGRIEPWFAGLARWGEPVQVRAALAAGRMALRTKLCNNCRRLRTPRKACGRCATRGAPEARRALDACAAWLDCPCEEHLQAWRAQCSLVAMGRHPWLPLTLLVDTPERRESLQRTISECSRIAGEPTVRTAIQRALIAWALDCPDQPEARAC